MSRDLRDLLDATVEGPSRPLDLDAVARTSRRRRRRDRAGVAAGLVAAVSVGALVVPGVLPGTDPTPDIADRPPAVTEEAVEIPDGWVTVTAGELAISVPPDWDVDAPAGRTASSEAGGVAFAGPCGTDLVPGLYDEDPPSDPPSRIRVLDGPTSGACNLAGHPDPDRPAIVIYETVIDPVTNEPHAERYDIDDTATRDRLGGTEVWAYEPHQPDGRFGFANGSARGVPVQGFVAAELTGALRVAAPDDPEVRRILATLRPAPGAVPRAWEVPRSSRQLDTDEWASVEVDSTDEHLPAGRALEDQVGLDDLWLRLGRDDDAPELPDGWGAIVATSDVPIDGDGCRVIHEVVDVRAGPYGSTIELDDPEDRGAEPCSVDPPLYVVAVAPNAEGVDRSVRTSITVTSAERDAETREVDVDAFEVLATDRRARNDAPDGRVVVDQAGLDWEWAGLTSSAAVPRLPTDHGALLVTTPSYRCVDADDVVGVTVDGRIRLHEGADLDRVCPDAVGRDGTLLVVAIPERVARGLGRASLDQPTEERGE